MRRKDRQMDEAFAKKLIDDSQYGVMSLVYKNRPLSRALSFVRDKDVLYFHSALEGEKVQALEEAEEVEVIFVGPTNVPSFYSDEEIRGLIEEKKEGLLLTRVFTTEFSSAMVRGRVEEVTGLEEKDRALRLVCEKYVPDKEQFIARALELSRSRVRVYRVDIKDIKAKRKKFDDKGEEIKWTSSSV